MQIFSVKSSLLRKSGDYTVLTTSINYATTLQTFAKRALDIVGGLLGCIATGIFFIFLAPVIYFFLSRSRYILSVPCRKKRQKI